MKITIECTPSDAADALLHLLDGGASGSRDVSKECEAPPDEASERLQRMIRCYDKPWRCLIAERELAKKGGDA